MIKVHHIWWVGYVAVSAGLFFLGVYERPAGNAITLIPFDIEDLVFRVMFISIFLYV